jgi:hypothetical protein
MRFPLLPVLVVLGISAASAACGDSGMGEVSLQLASHRAAATSNGVQASITSAPGQLTVSLGEDEIVFNQIQLVLRKIRLDGGPTASCPEDGEGDSQCGDIRLGPVLFDLPLAAEAEPTLTALVPVGTYDGFKFQLHRPSNATSDADLVAEHPEMEDISIRAVGTYNGTSFTFSSDLTDVEDVSLPQSVEVSEQGELPLTLFVDAAGWFANASGTGLIDPTQANDGGSYEAEVEQNIRESFRAFRDGDADGGPD